MTKVGGGAWGSANFKDYLEGLTDDGGMCCG